MVTFLSEPFSPWIVKTADIVVVRSGSVVETTVFVRRRVLSFVLVTVSGLPDFVWVCSSFSVTVSGSCED